MRPLLALLITVLLLAVAFAAVAQEEKLPVTVHGFLLGTFSGRTTDEQPLTGQPPPSSPEGNTGDFTLGEERLRLEVSGSSEETDALFLIKADVFHDSIANKTETDIREAYVGYTKGPFDLQLGRQILTWGVGDTFFINDVFPKDWESFFGGRPIEYLKLGVDGLRTRYSSGIINAEFLAMPFFTPDTMLSEERFFFYNPYSAVANQKKIKPESTFANTEVALRLYRQVADFDLSYYAYRGFWHTPGMRLDNPILQPTATQFYPKLFTDGLSVQRNVLGGVLSLEAGYYNSRDDRTGDKPAIPNSQRRYLAGYQYQLWEDFTAGVQAYSEYLEHYEAYRDALPEYLPEHTPVSDKVREVVATRLTQFLKYQTWKLSLFAAYSPTDKDNFLQSDVSYKVTDNFSVSLGTNIFGRYSEEDPDTFFGQLDKNDNVFLNARYDF